MSEEEKQIPDIEGNENPEQVKGKGKSKNGKGKSKNGKGKSKNGKGNVEQKTESEPPKQGDRITTEDGSKEYIIGESMGDGAGRTCYNLLDNEGNETGLVVLCDKEENTKGNKEILENVSKTESKFILRPEGFGKVGKRNYEIYKKGVPLNKFKKKDLEGREIAVSFGIILGLKDLHKNGLAHSDIKTNNFIVVEPIVKFTDFDKSVIYNGDKSKKVELDVHDFNLYSAPIERILHSEDFDPFKGDIYSAFTVIYEIITGENIINATEEIIREKYFKGDKETKFNLYGGINYRIRMGEEFEEKLISRFVEKCKVLFLGDEQMIKMLGDIAECMFQHNQKKRHSLDEILEKFKDIIKYQVNEKGLDPLKDLKIPNEALKEAGLENLAKNKKEEQKNEKSTNKIPNMNFTTVENYNKNSKSLVSSDSSFFDSEPENQQKNEETKVKEKNLELNNSSSLSEPEIPLPETKDKEIGIKESLKGKSKENESNSNRLGTDEERIKLNTMTNDVKKIGNENEKTAGHSLS